MPKFNRRSFFKAGGAALAAGRISPAAATGDEIDFRFTPLSWQTAFCFPDDHHKSLVGETGDLRYGYRRGKGIDYFPLRISFAARGMETGRVAWQRLEAPGIPVVHTRIDRHEAFLELTAFATSSEAEGRVDNVILEVRPRIRRAIHAVPIIHIRTEAELIVNNEGGVGTVRLGSKTAPPILISDSPVRLTDNAGSYELSLPVRRATGEHPPRCFFRFPQEGQSLAKLSDGLRHPGSLLAGARTFWQGWRPFSGNVDWRLPGQHGSFLTACARNILQAREVRNGKLTFQVGPTVYRGLWVVDGNFLLEAARYLGYDKEAQQGLETTWSRQSADGAIFAGGGREHWKDTGIAMFTMVRQAELSQDWSYFRAMKPNLLRAVRFLESLRQRARSAGSVNGRYGLLAEGFGDGGLGGIRPEFTNTVWVLAGLKAVVGAADRLHLTGFEDTSRFYEELRQSFFAAARQEMRHHTGGFEYLPMLMKEDPQWSLSDPWKRPRPQVAQWALSHAIYPGLVFEKEDPIVKGHIRLMQACTQEDIPAETGWLPHEGVWNYNAAFVAHVYLWAGLRDWARTTFSGFLNHASPLYCWREEQPIRGSLVAHYIGDMPHNWASAECVLYLRHMLALEDGNTLRLLAGISRRELAAREPYQLTQSPTRFGRLSLVLKPEQRGRGWRLEYQRGSGPVPVAVELPATLGSRFEFQKASGARTRRRGAVIEVEPAAPSWLVSWRA